MLCAVLLTRCVICKTKDGRRDAEPLLQLYREVHKGIADAWSVHACYKHNAMEWKVYDLRYKISIFHLDRNKQECEFLCHHHRLHPWLVSIPKAVGWLAVAVLIIHLHPGPAGPGSARRSMCSFLARWGTVQQAEQMQVCLCMHIGSLLHSRNKASIRYDACFAGQKWMVQWKCTSPSVLYHWCK